MEQNSSKKENSRKTASGAGLAIGAAIGIIFGLLLFDNVGVGLAIGVAVGMLIDAQGRHETGSDE